MRLLGKNFNNHFTSSASIATSFTSRRIKAEVHFCWAMTANCDLFSLRNIAPARARVHSDSDVGTTNATGVPETSSDTIVAVTISCCGRTRNLQIVYVAYLNICTIHIIITAGILLVDVAANSNDRDAGNVTCSVAIALSARSCGGSSSTGSLRVTTCCLCFNNVRHRTGMRAC